MRIGLLSRLAASRRFALGDRAGALRAAERRSARPFRLDVRQRVVVKALVSRHTLAPAGARGAALLRHVAYLGRSGAGAEAAKPEFFDREAEGFEPGAAVRGWIGDRHHFRFIISPEHGDRIADLQAYVREVMRRVGEDLGEGDLTWVATAHFDTDQPHAHVIVRGRRADGRDLVIPRAYISYGFRARAQEVAQERLGDLSRQDAERRIWRETEANRFTGLDRRLIAGRAANGVVADGEGPGAWAALLRGRLRHLEALGLAEQVGRGYRLDEDLERRLKEMQVRGDIIRTMNQRRMAGAVEVRSFAGERVRGQVMAAGHHDELGARPYVVVRDEEGVEHYARLASGASAPRLGAMVDMEAGPRGTILQRVAGLER